MATVTAPLLRTLAPALRGLEKNLRAWLEGVHRQPLSLLNRSALEGHADDLRRQADALDVDRPLLVIMLMGGTGVGKSTLLNALAGGLIAKSSVMRPTTLDPVVYYHHSIRPERLDPALRFCKLVPHDRAELMHKILVDTPDVDSTHLDNRDRLIQLLPVADIVLYVGSQEKYHDQIGWQLFQQHRKRRAFAFVMNKWDRCLHTGADGLRPDQDLLRDLESNGFHKPLLFRTCSQHWVDAAATPNGEEHPTPNHLPEGEQFQELLNWLEAGLTRLEIEAIKARGVSQMLHQLTEVLETVRPPDLTKAAEQVRAAWLNPLDEEADALAGVLLNTLEPHQHEIERHFALQGQRRFRGPMAAYLGLITRFQYATSSLRDRFSISSRTSDPAKPYSWDLSIFTRACSEVAASRQINARVKALCSRLLVVADSQGFPVNLLADPVEAVARQDWQTRHAQALSDVLQQVERRWTEPTGGRRLVHSVVLFLANWLPPLLFVASLLLILWRFFDPLQQGYHTDLSHFLLPLVVLIVVLVLMHLMISLLLPLRWTAIRDEFRRQLEVRVKQEMEVAYLAAPGEVEQALLREREQIDRLVQETRDVVGWLEQREQASSITGLYGN
jgi:energy-coupling factor transporter ATP-binding protein EcfA2